MVAVINQRATMLANPGRSSKKWDQKRQLQFENRIRNFTNPGSELGESFHDLQPLLSPFTEAGNRLIDSRSLAQPAGRRNTNKDALPEDEAGFYNQIGLTTGGLTAISFLEELRTSFPRFAKKGKYGRYGQQDAEELYSHIISQLKQKQRIDLRGECFPTWHSFIDKDLSGQMVSTLRCDEEPQDKPLTQSFHTFLNLNYQISSSSNHLRDGLLAGLSAVIPKYSPRLGRYASYTKTSRITRLPRYLTCLFVPVHRNRKINKRVKCNPKVIFPFELDATEFCAEVLRHDHSPAPRGLRDLCKDAVDCNRAGGSLGNLKSTAANPDDAAGGVVPANGFGAARSPLGSPAEGEMKGEAMAKSKEANLGDGEQWLIEHNHVISQDEGCNVSGLYELMGVITHEGTNSGSGRYCSYVKKGGGEDLWWCYRGEGVEEVPRHRIKTMADAGASQCHNPLVLLYRAVPLTPAPV
ncbi:hypothetical protein HOY82DRAFT_511881 [Tuber indicum]|nr:hypothetical protein HOY82DRAFT_511881 [Tuber indicum]